MINRLELPFSTIDRIYHVSDIHIKLVKAHDEYREIIDQLCAQLVKVEKTNAIIAVTGDIVHTKQEMSPEMVGLMDYLFRSLASIMPTVILLGNHDVNLRGQRVDSITPVFDLTAASQKNLFYLRDSGIYTVGDTQIAVWSLLGSREDWPKASDMTARQKILFYHGPVNGSETDVGAVMRTDSMTTDHFVGFDYVLLGDIHRYQVLQERSVETLEVSADDLSQHLAEGWELV